MSDTPVRDPHQSPHDEPQRGATRRAAPESVVQPTLQVIPRKVKVKLIEAVKPKQTARVAKATPKPVAKKTAAKKK